MLSLGDGLILGYIRKSVDILSHHSFTYLFNQQIAIECLHQHARGHLVYDNSYKSKTILWDPWNLPLFMRDNFQVIYIQSWPLLCLFAWFLLVSFLELMTQTHMQRSSVPVQTEQSIYKFWEEDHGGKVLFPSSHFIRLHTINRFMTVDADVDHLAEVGLSGFFILRLLLPPISILYTLDRSIYVKPGLKG